MDEHPVQHVPSNEIMDEEEFEKLYTAPWHIVALLSIFYGIISIVAVIGNTLVIWVVATTRQMRTITNMYIANLAFADVIIGLFCIPFQAALLQRWTLPWFMCGFCPFVQALSVNVSVFTLTAIAIDRHRAIINPLRARPTKFISKFIICAIWLVSLIFAIPCAIAFRVELIHERFKEDNIIYNMTHAFCMNTNLSDSQLQTYRYTLVFVQYLVPFCVISFVYIQMAVKLWGTRAPGNAQDSRDITLLKNKKKVIKMLIIVVVVFGLCWLPLQLYNILYVTIPEINEYHFISIVWFCCDWLAMSNSCYNPFIYGIYNEKFKREFNKRFATCLCRFQTSLDAQERTASLHTRASSIRSTYANSSMRVRNNLFGVNNVNGACAHSAQQPHIGCIYCRKSVGNITKNGGCNLTTGYNMIAYSNGTNGCTSLAKTNNNNNNNNKNGSINHSVVGGGGGVSGTANQGQLISQWHRMPDVSEHDDNDDDDEHNAVYDVVDGGCSSSVSIMEVCLPRSSNNEQQNSVESEVASNSSGCICEQELGSCATACDGTCILSEVSRVQAPLSRTTTFMEDQVQREHLLLTQPATTSIMLQQFDCNQKPHSKLQFNNTLNYEVETNFVQPSYSGDDGGLLLSTQS